MVSVPFPNNGQNKNFRKDFASENTGLVPPQNIQAEEAVLGGILLDQDAIGRIADLIKPEAFYINAHQEIYRTALMLHTQGCLLYTSPSPRDLAVSRMPSSA